MVVQRVAFVVAQKSYDDDDGPASLSLSARTNKRGLAAVALFPRLP